MKSFIKVTEATGSALYINTNYISSFRKLEETVKVGKFAICNTRITPPNGFPVYVQETVEEIAELVCKVI
jgi:uncharacterized protein YlzI (FlbEa/FlbD family)